MPPIFHLLAGPNGVGKSTLYAARQRDGTFASELPFINADIYEQTKLKHLQDPQTRSETARLWADAQRSALIAAQQSFVSETVFSHPSKLALIQEAQSAGFIVALYVLCVDNPQHLLTRVKARIAHGGHPVPDQRILARYPKTLTHLKQAIKLADIAFLYDTSPHDVSETACVGQITHVATVSAGLTDLHAAELPQWVLEMLAIHGGESE